MAKKKSTASRRRVTFVLRAAAGSKVFVGGTFNSWAYQKKQLKETAEGGVFKGVCMVAPGLYEYKFNVNGSWCVDPENPSFCQNEFGTLNSVLEVQ
ncbi:MAG: glycoside hydrolase [Victivallales bacterium]|jgi:1,4-alpha-glucan branching enzyme|nr:glycoside hydrolase [Victivallales bacterium]MBT7164441.1 glycoside hydrolase [Victivallales bacterium]